MTSMTFWTTGDLYILNSNIIQILNSYLIKIFDLKYSNPRQMQAAQEIMPTRVLENKMREPTLKNSMRTSQIKYHQIISF